MNTDNYLLTYSGKYVNLLDPDPACIDIIDIAHALSQINRFGGHTRTQYSVAQHCIHLSRLLPAESRLHGLLHDAAEAYLGDLVSPLKYQSFSAKYRDAESYFQSVIFKKFGCSAGTPGEIHEQIRMADLIMLATERRDLMPPDAHCWPVLDGIKPLAMRIWPLGSRVAETSFLTTFKELTGMQ